MSADPPAASKPAGNTPVEIRAELHEKRVAPFDRELKPHALSKLLKNFRPLGRNVIILVSLLVLLDSPALEAADRHYITNRAFADGLLYPPPQTNSSDDILDRSNAWLIASGWATNQEQVRIAKLEQATFSPFGSFAQVIGDFFNKTNLPATEQFLSNVRADTDWVTDGLKTRFHRQRLYARDLRFLNVVTNVFGGIDEHTSSYPSGHSTRGVVFSLILANMFPERKKEIYNEGEKIGRRRILVGLHSPKEVEAGRLLGTNIFNILKVSPTFQEDFGKAVNEVNLYLSDHPEVRRR